MEYRNLNDGEILNIGDEYFQNECWNRLSEGEYKEWITFRHIYDSSEMCPFRRKVPQDKNDAILSKKILDEALEKVMSPISDYIGKL